MSSESQPKRGWFDWRLAAFLLLLIVPAVAVVYYLFLAPEPGSEPLPETVAITAENATEIEMLRVLRDHTEAVRSLAFSPDGSLFASGSFDDTINIWRTADASTLLELDAHENDVRNVRFSADGQTLASASFDRTVRLWRVGDGELQRTLEGPEVSVNGVAFAPDGSTIAAAVNDGSIWLWDLTDSPPLPQVLESGSESVLSVAYSKDGLLTTGSVDRLLRLWDFQSNPPEGVPFGNHENWVYGLDFSPDGQSLASSSSDSTTRIWDMLSGDLVRTLSSGEETVFHAVFSPDGRLIATASSDGMVRIYDVNSGELLRTLDHITEEIPDDRNGVLDVVFSPDGRLLLTSTARGLIYVWGVTE